MADNIKLVTKEYVDTELSTKANKVISNMSYESFIDTYHLREPEWVDLSFVGGEYYYTDLTTAVTDVNNGNTASASSDKTGAVCQIFTDGNITVLRLLNDVTITTNIVFTKSVIFDINGFTVTSNGAAIGSVSSTLYDIDIVIYGTKINSNIISTNKTQIFGVNSKNLFILGGKYKMNALTKGASILFVNTHDSALEKINVEIYNAELEMYSELLNNVVGCIIILDNNIPVNLVMHNTIGNTNAMNYSGGVLYVYPNVQETTKVYVSDCTFEGTGADKGDTSSIAIASWGGYVTVVNSVIKGITSGINNRAILHIKNSKCYSPYHGGFYNSNSKGILYAENTEFHRSETPEGYTPTAYGCAYFGYGSTAYLNNCKFIRDVESDTSPGIVVRKEGTPEGETTRVFVSNSEMPGIRCDADQEIYLGTGISDTIKNATVQGIKYLTDNNYVYIEESNAAYSLLNPNAIVASQSTLDQKQDTITSTSTITLDTLKANIIESQDGDLEVNAETHITDGKTLYATAIDMQYGGTNKGVIQGLADITNTSTGDVAVNKNYVDSIVGDISTILATIVEVSE